MFSRFAVSACLLIFGTCLANACQAQNSQENAQIAKPIAQGQTLSGNKDNPADEAARQKILQSPEWVRERGRFTNWLSVQKSYDPDEVEALQGELQNRIARMSATELASFLVEMQEKLDVLLAPATTDARLWVDHYFTDKKQREIVKKYGVEDPVHMSAGEITAAVLAFEADRRSKRTSAAANDRVRQSNVRAVTEYNKSMARTSAARTTRRPASSYGSSYAPKQRSSRPHSYQPAYKQLNYSVGPWGGVWVSPRL